MARADKRMETEIHMSEIEDGHIGAFTPDPRNARKHTPKNLSMIEHSLNEVGAGRSIVTTRDGMIIAGNATVDAAAAAGIERVKIVHTNGEELIVHVRDDLESGDKRATLLGLYDNRSSDLSEWDMDTLIDIQDEFKNDPAFDHIFNDRDFDKIMFGNEGSQQTDASPQLDTLFAYRVVVDCADEHDQAALIAELESQGRSVKALIS